MGQVVRALRESRDLSSRVGNAMPRHAIGSKRAGRGLSGPGFSLAEMMVVVAVIALLLAMLVPSLNGIFAVAHKTSCQGNLFRIAQTLHSDTRGNANISSGYSWLGVTLANAENSRDLVWCAADNRDRTVFNSDALLRILERCYILQYNGGSQTDYVCSYFPDILGGRKVPDPQVWAWYPAGGVRDAPKGEEWPNGTLPDLDDDEIFIGVDNDGAVRITPRGQSIVFENWKPPASSLSGYSRQFVCKGAATPPSPLPGSVKPEDDDDKMIIEMYGWDNKKYGDKVSIDIGAQTSYGINSLVEEKNWRPEQILVMDANELVVEVGSASKEDFLDEVLVPRHMGKLNVATCDGGVRPMTMLEMEMELRKSRSLWRHR